MNINRHASSFILLFPYLFDKLSEIEIEATHIIDFPGGMSLKKGCGTASNDKSRPVVHETNVLYLSSVSPTLISKLFRSRKIHSKILLSPHSVIHNTVNSVDYSA